MKRSVVITIVIAVFVAWAVVACRSASPTFDSQSRDEIEKLEKLVRKSVDPERADAAQLALAGVKAAERDLFRAVRRVDSALFAVNRDYTSTAVDLRRVLVDHSNTVAQSRSALLSQLEKLKNSVSGDEWTRIHGGLAALDIR